MNHSVNFSDTSALALDIADRGERVRYLETLGVFEDMHRSLKERVAETPERRALEGLDAVLSLVAPGARRVSRHLDLDSFAAFRGSIEVLHDHTPEARALELFEGALRQMMAAAPDFDDLPDADEAHEAETAHEDHAHEAEHTHEAAHIHDTEAAHAGPEDEHDENAADEAPDEEDGAEEPADADEAKAAVSAHADEDANHEAAHDHPTHGHDEAHAAAHDHAAGEPEAAADPEMASDLAIDPAVEEPAAEETAAHEPAHAGEHVHADEKHGHAHANGHDTAASVHSTDEVDLDDMRLRISELEAQLAAAQARHAA